MANIRDKTALIRNATHGKDVREALASGIEAISDQEDSYESNLTNRQNTFESTITENQNIFQSSITNQQNTYEENITGRQDNLEIRQTNLETRQTNLENTFTQEIENAVSQNPSSAETVYARTDHVNNMTYHNLGERLDDLIAKLGYVPVDGGSFFETYIEFEKDGGTF
jgi:hypothetical protein